jgi:hypothetical protein
MKDWAPLQNLCRLYKVKEAEVDEKYEGRTAMEWALYHGELGLAGELAYLLVR